MFDGFFEDIFELEPQVIEPWDIVLFSYVDDGMKKLGISVDYEYILLEKYYDGAIYIRLMDYYERDGLDYELVYLKNPHEDILFRMGKVSESMKKMDSTLIKTINSLKHKVDVNDLPEFLEKLENSNYKNNIQMMIDTAIDDGNFELAKHYMDELGGEL